MTIINELNSIDQTSGSDLLPIWSQANGASRKISLTNLLAWLDDQAIATQDNKTTQYSAPVTGATVQVDDDGSIWLILTPAGTISTMTLKFPLLASVADKTEILFNTTNTITTLTLDANGATIVGGISTLAANAFATYRYDLVMHTWYRVN